MTLTQLRYVVAVDTHRHFARAAAACGVSQPTLSVQVARLERSLGLELFDRARSPVEPTDIGRRVIEQARVTLREAARIAELVTEAGSGVAGELRVGILPTLAPYLLPRFVADLGRRYPGLMLRVEELQTAEVVSRLIDDRLDVAVVATPVSDPRLIERPLFEEPFVGYVSEGHRLSDRGRLEPDDLRLEDLWLLSDGHCFRDQVLSVCREAAKADADEPTGLRFESGNLETLKRLVDGGGGMTLLPALAVPALTAPERVRVRPFRAPAPTRMVRLVHPRAYLKRARVEAFAKELLNAIPTEYRYSPREHA